MNPPSLSVCRSRWTHVTSRRVRRRRISGVVAISGRRRARGGSGCAAPLLKWKFVDRGERGVAVAGSGAPVAGGRRVKQQVSNEGRLAVVSSRKLGAALWRLEAGSTSGHGDGGGVRWHSRPLDWLKLELQPSDQVPRLTMERAENHLVGNLKSVREQQIASALQEAQNRLGEIETERELAKKKLKLLLRNMSEERSSWLRREHEKFGVFMYELKDQLKRERRNFQKMKTEQSKLQSDLIDAKSLTKRLAQKYEKEREARVAAEDVCRELDQEREANKAEIRALKSEHSRIRVEIEEERKVLQMAGLFREEQVHMKLMEAKLFLEEKCCQMNDLMADVEIFLKSRSLTLDMLSEEDKMKNLQEMMELEISCMPPESNAFKNLPGTDESCRETLTCAEDVSLSNNNPGESESSVMNDGSGRGRNSLRAKTGQEDLNAHRESFNSQTSGISSVSELKDTSGCKTINSDSMDNRLPNESSATIKAGSPGKVLADDGAQQGCSFLMKSQQSDPAAGTKNPHLDRAMKGCIEWPRVIPRSGLKAKLLEARFASQRTQLRCILKQKN